MKLIKGDDYLTSDGFKVTFIRSIEEDDQYNVFRHQKKNDYRPYYTDSNLKTAYGEEIIGRVDKNKQEPKNPPGLSHRMFG